LSTRPYLRSFPTRRSSDLGIQAPRGTLEEGRLSIYWLPPLSRLALMRFVAHYLAGRVKETPGFRSFRTARAKLQSSRPRLRLGIDRKSTRLNSSHVSISYA